MRWYASENHAHAGCQRKRNERVSALSHCSNVNDTGPADLTLTFGVASDLPMSWR